MVFQKFDIMSDKYINEKRSKLKYKITASILNKIENFIPNISFNLKLDDNHKYALYKTYNELTRFYKIEGIKKLRLYIKVLYQYLGEINQCFFDGSFVIEDNDEKLLDVLIQSSSVNLGRFSTHEGFKPENFTKTMNTMDLKEPIYTEEITADMKENNDEYNVEYTCDRVCETHLRGYTMGEKSNYKISCLALTEANGKKLYNSVFRNNVLWYKFTRNEKKYIFLKITQKKSSNIDYKIHGSIYRLSEKFGKKYDTRNEDSNYDTKFDSINIKNIVINSTHLIEKPHNSPFYKGGGNYQYIIKDIDNKIYGRLGNEFFIPELLSKFFLKYTNYVGSCNSQNNYCHDNIKICKKGDIVYIYDTGEKCNSTDIDSVEKEEETEEVNDEENDDDDINDEENQKLLRSLKILAKDGNQEAKNILELFKYCDGNKELISNALKIIKEGINNIKESSLITELELDVPSSCNIRRSWAGGSKSKPKSKSQTKPKSKPKSKSK